MPKPIKYGLIAAGCSVVTIVALDRFFGGLIALGRPTIDIKEVQLIAPPK